MISKRIHPFVKTFGFLMYLFSLFYFWKVTVDRIVEVMRIPGVTFFNSLLELPRISRLKMVEIESFYQPFGQWLVKPDYLFFLLLVYLMVLILVIFPLKWKALLIIMLGLFFPQFTALFIGILAIRKLRLHIGANN